MFVNGISQPPFREATALRPEHRLRCEEVPSPTRFEGGFEAARAEAFRSSKLLVVSAP